MPNRCLLSCPDVNMQHDIRVKTLACTVTGWIHSDAFTELIELFGGNTVKSGHLKEHLWHSMRLMRRLNMRLCAEE